VGWYLVVPHQSEAPQVSKAGLSAGVGNVEGEVRLLSTTSAGHWHRDQRGTDDVDVGAMESRDGHDEQRRQ